MSLTGRVAVITGAGRGIGHAVAAACAARGARVAVLDREMPLASAAAEALREAGALARAYQADVARLSQVRQAVEAIAADLGTPYLLVNNAGVSQQHLPTLAQDAQEWETVIDTDLKGTLYCTAEAGRLMVQAGRGIIVNIASITGLAGFPGRAAYSAAKAGVVALTRSLAAEWASSGINVNAVAPGYVRTPMIEQRLAAGDHDLAALERRIPMGRLASAEEIAGAVLFLASEEARYITGVTLPVDGGWLANGDYRPVSREGKDD